MRRIAITLAAAALGVVAAAAATAPSANAAGFWIQYSDRANGLCMDVKGGSTADGALVQEFGCKIPNSSGSGNQQFQIQAVTGGSRIVAQHSSKCIAISGASTLDGAAAVQATCTGAANQLWQVSLVSTNPNGSANLQFKNVNSGKCLTGSISGATLVQTTCSTANAHQVWHEHLADSGCTTCAPVPADGRRTAV